MQENETGKTKEVKAVLKDEVVPKQEQQQQEEKFECPRCGVLKEKERLLWEGMRLGILLFLAAASFVTIYFATDSLRKSRADQLRRHDNQLVIPRMNPNPVYAVPRTEAPKKERTSTLMRESRYVIHEVSNLARETGRFGK